MQSKKKGPKRKTFKQALALTDDIKECYRDGLQGLGEHRNKIVLQNPRECGGSVEIDDCTAGKYPDENRWDYAFDYKGEVFFMEVHPANTSEVSTVLKKLQWLKDWLRDKAPEVNNLKRKNESPFYWVQSRGYHILKNSPQERVVIQKGLKPVSRITLN